MVISDNLRSIIGDTKTVFLLDYSWHLHRSYHTFKNLTAGPNGLGRPTGHIYGILSTLQLLRTRYPDSVIILCQDGVPVKRRELYESKGLEYKSGRSELEFNFYQDIPTINGLAYLIPRVYLAYHPEQESDDCMYALAKQIESFSLAKIYIFSGDNDLLQSISDNIMVFRNFNSITKNPNIIDNTYLKTDDKMISKFYETDSYHLPYFRAIVGDSSDSMRGIPRFPKRLAHHIAMRCSSVDDIFLQDKKSLLRDVPTGVS